MTKSRYSDFVDFFCQATGHQPYSYQKELAKSDSYNVVNVPTGAGKTESAVLGLWLWKRMNDERVPKRLVYCLPMRVLAEQTYEKVKKWIKNLDLEERISVHLIMGGSDARIATILPNKECIIIGTQDILVSGALNRAYGANTPYSWPIVFGWLNNDCMWIMDEIQIMENALPTSMQLDSFRNALGVFGPHRTVWMSATINPSWMETADFHKENIRMYHLKTSKIEKSLQKRHRAPKRLQKASFSLKAEYSKKDIEKMLDLHKQGTSTAIILNTVKRAQSVFKMLSEYHDNCKLIHSRFRGVERRHLNSWLSKFKGDEDQIIVSTQVIEAGVDISVRTIITELAPWANMVQRFGRCNRYGELNDADIYWIDVDKKMFLPYEEEYMERSRDEMNALNNKHASPGNLKAPERQKPFDAVLRKRDIIGLFDTTPDLSGGHIDVSRFVRSMKLPLDIGVFWRDIDGDNMQGQPKPEEVCDVPISDLRGFLKNRDGWVWNYVDESWRKITRYELFPGQTIMLSTKNSGYSKTLGWDPAFSEPVEQVPQTASSTPESHDDDQHSQRKRFVTLADHTENVMRETKSLLRGNAYVNSNIKEAISTAAMYHDIGKAHSVFQKAVRQNTSDKPHQQTVYAKSPSLAKYERPGFRHEVASMLVYLGQNGKPKDELRDLIAYLIASHHGKVRLSLGASKTKPIKADDSFLLGITVNGEVFQAFTSPVVSTTETKIDMSLANMGRDTSGNPSWSERVLKLLGEYGPFRLGYMEALLRRADWHASEKEDAVTENE